MQRIPTIPTLIDCIEKIIPEAKESGSGGNATVFRVEGNYAIKVEPGLDPADHEKNVHIHKELANHAIVPHVYAAHHDGRDGGVSYIMMDAMDQDVAEYVGGWHRCRFRSPISYCLK